MRVLFIAPVDEFSLKDTGYGTAAAGIAYVLKKMVENKDIEEVKFINISKFKGYTPPKDTYDISITVTNPNGLVGPRSVTPKLAPYINAGKRRYLSVVWETDRLPPSWRPLWTDNTFDGFLSPSIFVGDMLVNATDKPVYYYPHYIHADEVPPVNIEDKVAHEDQFSVLYMGQHTKRKGLEDAVIAFTRALGYEADARLVLKYHTMTQRELNADLLIKHAVLCNTSTARPKAAIFSVTDMLAREQLCKMYSSSSVLLFPTRGEGFGLPPAEAMCAGIPVIYTNWSSCPEICNAPGNIPIGFTLDEAHSMTHHGYGIGANYAVPSMRELVFGLRKCYDWWKKDKREYYENVAGNRSIIESHFGYGSIRSYLLHIITGGEGFVPGQAKEEVHAEDNQGVLFSGV